MMNYLFNKYKYYVGLIISTFFSAAWGIWQGFPLWQMFTLILGALIVFLCRVWLNRMIVNRQSRWVKQWCQAQYWTDPFIQDNQFYAFPPHAVIPLPVPLDVIKAKKAASSRLWQAAQVSLTALIPPIILGSLFVVVLQIVSTLSLLVFNICIK